jgi:alkaline phosphatase
MLTRYLFGLNLLLGSALAAEPTPQQWFEQGAAAVRAAEEHRPIPGRARNVILFIGDGMGITTVTAARILDGQQHGQSGEENILSFERFPNVALAKTYSVNQQTPDSAPTATALLTGVKTNDGAVSVDHGLARNEGRAAAVAARRLHTLLERAEQRGLATGIVTTTRVTHATPAAAFAHIGERDWECDADINVAGADVPDIARQLVEFPYGDGIDVVLGGGRTKFLPASVADPEYPDKVGARKDGRNLIEEWSRAAGRRFVWSRDQFAALEPATAGQVLGLFERSHMRYEADREKDAAGEPSLAEMTAKAIQLLARNPDGYFLEVEGGRIDHAHHAGNAYRALTDTIAFAAAVQVAVDLTRESDTLIIVTADHSHTLSINGFPKRGNPILGKVVEPGKSEPARDALGLPFTTLTYANGPGYSGETKNRRGETQGPGVKTLRPGAAGEEGFSPTEAKPAIGRPDLSEIDTEHADFMQEALFPYWIETHGGEDVAIYARGPGAHLVRGVMEQNAVFHVMLRAFGW